MKLNILLVLFLTITKLFVYGQNKIQGHKLDKITNEPLPYATIGALGLQYGCYTDTSGFFTLYYKNKKDSLKISYLGYKNIYTTVHNLLKNTKILLEPNTVQLKELVVKPSKYKTKEIGFFSKKRHAVRVTSYPLNLHATFIAFPENCIKVYIKSIKFTYEMAYKNYPLRVSILKVKATGVPGDDILTENIVFSKYKSLKQYVAEIDVSKYDIIMPNNGVFIALEWIMDKPPVGINNQEGKAGPYIGLVKTSNINAHFIGAYNQSEWDVVKARMPHQLA